MAPQDVAAIAAEIEVLANLMARLEEEVHGLGDRLANYHIEVREHVVKCNATCPVILQTVDAHERILRGKNGSPGVLSQIRELSTAASTAKKLMWGFGTMIGMLLVGILTAGVGRALGW